MSISCEHGLLRRQCALCDAIQENSELRTRIAELEAQVSHQRAGVPDRISLLGDVPMHVQEESMGSVRAAYREGWNKCREAMLTAAVGREEMAQALTDLCDEIEKHSIHTFISATNIAWFKRKAREALSATQAAQEVHHD